MSFQQNPKKKKKKQNRPSNTEQGRSNLGFFQKFAAASQQVFINCDHTDIKIKKKTAPQPSYLLILSMFSAKIYNALNTTAPTPPPSS